VGLIKLVYDVYVILYINGIKDFDEIFINLIHLAEYLLVGVTFFSIAKRLMVESYFKSEDNAEEARKPINIPDLEKHIIGMVVATISVGFIGFVVSGNAGDITLKFGIGVGAFITSLGLYLKLSSHKNDATVDILRQELMQLRTKDKESNQDGTPTTAELQEGRQY